MALGFPLLSSHLVALTLQGPAEPEAFSVSWDAPAGCPPQSAIRSRIETLVGGPLAGERGAGMGMRGRAEENADGTWTAVLELSSPDGVRERTIPNARDCAEAAEAVAVIVAIAVDPSAAERLAAAEEQTQAQAEAAVVAPPELVPTPQAATEATAPPEEEAAEAAADGSGRQAKPEPARDSLLETTPPPPQEELRLRGVVGVLGGVGTGNTPGVPGVLGVEGGVALRRLRATVAGQYWFRQTADVENASVDYRQWSIALRSGPVLAFSPRLEVLVTGGVEAGQTIVRTRGLDDADDPNDPWIAWLVQPALTYLPRPWLGLRLGVETFGPFVRAAYRVRNPDREVFRPSVVGVRGLLGVEVRIY